MRSIRLSLIFYFLVLLTLALAAVSWFSYRTTEQSLRERQSESVTRIQSECDASCESARADLDRRLLQQAHALVRISKSAIIHAEAQLGLLGMIGAGAMPQGHLHYAVYAHQTTHKDPALALFRLQPMSTHIEGADNLVEADANHAKEYFQVYRGDGYTLQRSDTMEDNVFTLDETFREKGEAPSFKYDDVALEPGTKVRRLTLKTHIPSHDVVYLTWPFINFNTKPGPPLTPPNLFGLGAPPKGAPKGPTKGPSKGGFRPPSVFVSKAPIFYVQYASDLGPTEAKIAGFQQKRDQQINRLAITVDRELAQLRGRMMWIGLSALGALLLGGYLVIRLGLAPLSKMSDAVSKVSARNFHLPLETKRLPDELLPIADRLVELLRHLEKAFAREKQAAADISHELRTPLAALMTTLEVGLKKPRSPDEYREILDECRASGQHMYQLVERLLTLARLDAGVDQYRPVETDVTEVALACADLIRPLARARGLALRLHLSEPITTETDPNKLREVLTNLLHNAVEYNKENGAIDLTVERDNGRIRFEVRDTGIGIKPAEREHLFERFYRADPSRHADTPHAGLGLAIVKSYVDLLGGTIKVESSEAGTAFTVELPYTASIHDIETAVRAGPALVQR